MDPIPAQFLPQSEQDKYLHASHKDRWNYFKEITVDLYLGNYGKNGRSTTVDEVVEFMKTYYSFHAAPTEYRTWFRAWGVNKRILQDEKQDATNALARRKRPGTSTSQVNIRQGDRDKPLDAKKLKRYLKDGKHHRPTETIPSGLLSSWNLPYAAFVSSLPRNPDKPSPFGPLGATPGYLNIHSPEFLTPGREAAGPSPNMQLIYQKAKEDRASLFLQGRLQDLVVSMCQDDRRVFFDYFHDFYMHGYVMAKTWGTGSSNRITIATSSFIPQRSNISSPFTPQHFTERSSSQMSPQTSLATNVSLPPDQFCRWTIHVMSGAVVHEVFDEPDATTTSASFVEFLGESMSSNTFTSISVDDLPLAKETIMRSLEGNQTALQLDAWKLAIMAGNIELLASLLDKSDGELPEDIGDIYPIHLAASFLDGGNTCCSIVEELCAILGVSYAFHHNVNDLGHTILDTLMVCILRSHTRVDTETVSYSFRNSNRFPGEEKDICGRWDAETPIVRNLFREGYCRIPHKWKHPFCHTSVQAICHSIIAIFASPVSPDIDAPSGLFLRRCIECGKELKLGPLHTLVVTAFYLAQLGMPGETLFGTLSVLVCLLTMGADVCVKADVSVEEILRTSQSGQCSHTPLSALELMRVVPDGVVAEWSEECQTGWHCFFQTLVRAEASKGSGLSGRSNPNSESRSTDDSDDDSDWGFDEEPSYSNCEMELDLNIHSMWLKLPCVNPQIGLLWATIQTELLTYRKLGADQAWISNKFCMKALKAWLEGYSEDFCTPLVQNNMLQMHSPCGWFYNANEFLVPSAQQVCREYFMNMEIYERASFIRCPRLCEMWEQVEYLEKS